MKLKKEASEKEQSFMASLRSESEAESDMDEKNKSMILNLSASEVYTSLSSKTSTILGKDQTKT